MSYTIEDLKTLMARLRDPETGCPWDLSSGKVRNKVVALIRDSRPYMLVCSPMCTAFSAIQALNSALDALSRIINGLLVGSLTHRYTLMPDR